MIGNSVLGDVKGIRAELGAVLGLVAVTNPFRDFISSPEVVRLVVMMYVRTPLSLRDVGISWLSAGSTSVMSPSDSGETV